MRYHGGKRQALRWVRVPSVEAEDQRRLYRERERLLKERTQHRNRLQSLVVAQGLRVQIRADFGHQVPQLRLWDGSALPEDRQAELIREWERYEVVQAQVRTLEGLQKQRVAADPAGALALVQELRKLRAVGWQSAWGLVTECFGWRTFGNRREVAAWADLTPTP